MQVWGDRAVLQSLAGGCRPGVAVPVWLALGVVAATVAHLSLQALWPVGTDAAVCVSATLLAAGVWRRTPRLALCLLGGAVALGLASWRGHDRLHDRLDTALWGRDVQIVGVVASLPVLAPQGMRFVLAPESALLQGEAVRVPQRLQLSWWREDRTGTDRADVQTPDLVVGDRWALTVRLKPVHGLSNPFGPDRELHAWAQGIGGQGSIRGVPDRLGPTGQFPLERWRQQVSRRLQDRLQTTGHGGVLAALAVGDQDALTAEDWQLFRRTGVAHLMAISGLHITLFAGLAVALAGRAWRLAGRWQPALLLWAPASSVAAVLGWSAATAYALAAGWGVPAQRTVLMLGLALWLRRGALRWPGSVQWLVVLAVVLLLEPWAWLQAGFWLSFVAVGLLMASDPGQAGPGAAHGSALRRLLREQAVITLALTPLSVWLFGEVSVVGLLANLVAIPWVSFLVTPLTLLGAVWTQAWDLAALTYDPLHRVLSFLADVPWAAWSRPVWPLPWALAAIAGGLLVVMPWPPLWRSAGALALGWCLLWSPDPPAPGHFRLLALDVGQGSSVLVQTRRHALLHDTGPAWGAAGDAGARVVVPTLRALGVAPDLVMVSHRDSDHAGGSQAVRQAWPLAAWSSSEPALAPERCQRGQRWTWDGVRFEVLSPEPDDYAADGRGRWPSNAMSCVLRVEAADGTSAVLTGDVDAPREARMALTRPDLRTDLLLAPHHGSRSASSPLLLNAWQPSVVIVQAGFMNRFGHPATEVLQRYRERQMQVLATPVCGAVTWLSERPQQIRCERDERLHPWTLPTAGILAR